MSVARRYMTLALCAAAAVGGIWLTTKLKIEAFPDVTNVQVMVISLVPGQAAEEVERKVTIPVERALVGLVGSQGMRSVTSFGLSQVTVTFEDAANIYFARQQVQERLLTAEVPAGVVPTLGPNDTPVGQIYQYTLDSDRHSPTELRSWQNWVVSRHLTRVRGVADVVSFGGFQKEYHVLADPFRLRAMGVTLAQLTEAVARSNAATSGGYLRHGDSEFVVRSRGLIEGPQDIENTVVRATGGTPVLVKQVATVVVSATPRRGTVARGEAIDSVEGTVLLRRGENPREVLAALHAAVDQINRDVLPVGMRLTPFYDRSHLVDTTLTTVTHNMLEGALLVALVIWLFLRTARGSLVVAVTLPMALLTAFVGLYAIGVPANLLSMGAIDFGILLDGAVILVENAYRHLAAKKPPAHAVPEIIAQAAREVVRPTLFSMLIIVAAMLPIFTLERIEGRIFRPVALTYAFALGGALFFTLTLVPALAAVLLANARVSHVEPRFLVALRRSYLWALRGILRRPWPARFFATALLATALLLLPRLGTEFLPQMNEGDLHITITMPSTVSLEAGHALLGQIRRELLEFAVVEDVVTEQGHPEDGTDDEAPNQAKTFVKLKPQSQWPSGMTHDSLIEQMRQALQRRPGLLYNFSQPIKDRVEEAISGVRGQVVVKLFGDNLQAMQATMEQVRTAVSAVAGARDVEIYRAGSASHVVADVDRLAAARLGLSVQDVEGVVEAAFGGTLSTSVWEGERQVGVRVKFATPLEGDVDTVGNLPIPYGTGSVPLRAVAHVHMDTGRTQINREEFGRFLALKCNIEGRDMGTFVTEAQERVAAQVAMPAGTFLRWGGEFENQRRAMHQLAIIVPVSILAIFLLLYATFNAVLPAMVVLCGLPFAAVGGVFALFMTHTTLSVAAAIGFITLFGVATMDGVLLITYLRQAQALYGPHDEQAILTAVSQRLRPVLMTALLASLGLVPAAMSHAIGSDTQKPFAIVIIGGLASSTVLTMLFLPTLYDLFEKMFGRRIHQPLSPT